MAQEPYMPSRPAATIIKAATVIKSVVMQGHDTYFSSPVAAAKVHRAWPRQCVRNSRILCIYAREF
jgi:hypothetical protein